MPTRTADFPWREALRQVRADLRPFPGRFTLTWQVALLCALVTAVAMTLKIPEASISCYLIIFLMKRDAVMNCLMGVGLILLATGVVVAMIPIINASIDSPAMRLSVMFFASYVFLFLSSTTPLGEQAAIVGLIVAFIMTLVGLVPVGEIGNEGLLMAWKMACMPMMLMVLFNLLLGTPSQTHVRNKVVERLRRAADRIGPMVEDRQGGPDVVQLLGEGNDQPLQQMMLVRLLHLVPKARSDWLNGAVESSYRVLVAACTLPDDLPQAQRADLSARLRAAADAIAAGRVPPAGDAAAAVGAAERTLLAALEGLSRADGGGDPKPRAIPLLAHDAFSNSYHQRYALKTSIAACLCYLIYTGIHWNGIHTAMITCYVAALGTTGETVRKLVLRICGCLIGAAMGVLSLLWIMPHLTSVGGLMGLVFCAVLVGAWVSTGPERLYYAGVQISLAFLLTTLNGFGPSFEFDQASGRIFGILLGIVVIFVIFTQFWPRSVVAEIRLRMVDAMAALTRLAALPEDDTRARTEAVTAAQIAVGQALDLLDMAPYEPRRLRALPDRLDRIRELLLATRSLTLRMALPGAAADTPMQEIETLAAVAGFHDLGPSAAPSRSGPRVANPIPEGA